MKRKKIWLKYSLGIAMLAAVFLLGAQKTYAATYVVTNTNDSGAGSLRDAIVNANTNAGADQIDFNISGSGQHTITLANGFPSIADQVKVNGLSQPGSVCNGPSTQPNIAIQLAGLTNAISLVTGAEGSEINGLAIAGAGENAYGLYNSADNVTVRCNFFGTFNGNTVASTQLNSDWFASTGNNTTIGGLSATDLNLFAGSANDQILISGTGTTVQHNFIGTTVDGLSAASAGSNGIEINGLFSDSTISDNLILSPTAAIVLSPPANTSENIHIEGNFIGVYADGNTPFSSAGSGIYIIADLTNLAITNNVITSGAVGKYPIYSNGSQLTSLTIQNNHINVSADGTTEFQAGDLGASAINITSPSTDDLIDGNLIFSKTGGGIAMASMQDSVVTGNVVGMDSSRTNCFPNQQLGIALTDSQNNVVGGVGVNDGNTVCTESLTASIQIQGVTTSGNSILGNSFRGNGGAIFNNLATVITPPTIRAVEAAGVNTQVTFDLDVPAGNYRIEFFDNPSRHSVDGYPEATTFTGYVDVTSTGTGPENFSTVLPGNGHNFLTITATLKDGSVDGFGATSAVGEMYPNTDLQVETTDSVTGVLENTTGHEMVQNITNLGPSSVTDLTFILSATDCFNVTGITASGTATDTGSYASSAWSGVLEPGQTLTLTFTGDITCGGGSQLSFEHYFTQIKNQDLIVSEVDGSNGIFNDQTNILSYTTGLDVETSDGTANVLAGTTNHQINQSITNTGPNTVTDLTFILSATDCFNVTGITASGTATDTGSYASSAWSGVLEPGQTLTLTFTGDITCAANNQTNFTHSITAISNSGTSVTNTSSNTNYTDTTNINDPVTDLSVDKTLNNPQDLAQGATLNYTLTLTNRGPQSVDLSLFDGSGQNPFATSLFLDIMPADLTFVNASSTNPDINCSFLAPASLAGPLLATHSDSNIISCLYTGSGTLSANDTISTTISVVVGNSSSLTFTNYALTGWPQYDPDSNAINQPFGGTDCDPVTDIIDCYKMLGINNIAETSPVADLGLTKTLADPQDVSPGNTITYDVTVHNNGPMAVDLKYFSNQNVGQLFVDVYPAADLTFIGAQNADVNCIDIGPGSIAFIGNAGMDHQTHQLLPCVTNPLTAPILPVGGDFTVHLQFTVNANPSQSFNNYVLSVALPSDAGAQEVLSLFDSATSDILDTTPNNDNLAKASATLVTPTSTTPVTPSHGQNLASTGQNQTAMLLMTTGLVIMSVSIYLKRRKQYN